jgi:hypothetical protein
MEERRGEGRRRGRRFLLRRNWLGVRVLGREGFHRADLRYTELSSTHYSIIPPFQVPRLFLKILLKDPIVHLLHHLEGHLAIGAEYQVTGRFIPI